MDIKLQRKIFSRSIILKNTYGWLSEFSGACFETSSFIQGRRFFAFDIWLPKTQLLFTVWLPTINQKCWSNLKLPNAIFQQSFRMKWTGVNLVASFLEVYWKQKQKQKTNNAGQQIEGFSELIWNLSIYYAKDALYSIIKNAFHF